MALAMQVTQQTIKPGQNNLYLTTQEEIKLYERISAIATSYL
jgi:hypothetical protein